VNLHIDSTNNLVTKIQLGEHSFSQNYSSPRDQDILGFIQKTLQECGIEVSQITSVTVNPGPGSFTGCRLGVAVANALAFSLGVSVNNQPPPVLPKYEPSKWDN